MNCIFDNNNDIVIRIYTMLTTDINDAQHFPPNTIARTMRQLRLHEQNAIFIPKCNAADREI